MLHSHNYLTLTLTLTLTILTGITPSGLYRGAHTCPLSGMLIRLVPGTPPVRLRNGSVRREVDRILDGYLQSHLIKVSGFASERSKSDVILAPADLDQVRQRLGISPRPSPASSEGDFIADALGRDLERVASWRSNASAETI